MKSNLFIIFGFVSVIQVASGQDACPCELLEADPLFPGDGGMRWNCQDNGLTTIPIDCWAINSDVTQVFLDYNEITTVDQLSFAGLSNLKTLSIKQNKIASIDDEAFADFLDIGTLDLSGNRLENLPSSLWNLDTLTNLNLGDNRLAEVQNYHIENLVNLQVLDLHLNQLSQIPYRSLEPLKDLRHLYLYWNMIVTLPILDKNIYLEEFLVNGNALVDFPKYVFADNLTAPLTYHFVDNPAYDIWATMLLPLPDGSHIKMGFDVFVWAEDEAQAQELLQKDWVVQDGLNIPIDLSALVRICPSGQSEKSGHGLRNPPC